MQRLRIVKLGELARKPPKKRVRVRPPSIRQAELDEKSKNTDSLVLDLPEMERYLRVRASYFVNMKTFRINSYYRHRNFELRPVFIRPLVRVNGMKDYKELVADCKRKVIRCYWCTVDPNKVNYICQVIRPSQYSLQPIVSEELIPEWYLKQAIDKDDKVLLSDIMQTIVIDDCEKSKD